MAVNRMNVPEERRVLVISLAPFKFATRSRKAASVLARTSSTVHLSPARVGRNKMWDKAGSWMDQGVEIVQVPAAQPRTEPTRSNQVFNIMICYLPAFLRMSLQTIRRRADVVFVSGPSLIALGLLHKMLFRSELILDINERPGMVGAKGSAAAVFSRMETRILKLTASFVDTATVVTYADVEIVRSLGFNRVKLVRNVPMSSWKAPYERPPLSRSTAAGRNAGLRAIAMGSVFEGRGYESLIEAIAIANQTSSVRLVICGPTRDAYLSSLVALAKSFEVDDLVEFKDPVPSNEVSATYLDADVGMVLYESLDPGNDGLSNKLFECVASGRPVIASDLPENHRFVWEHQVGWLTQTDAASIAKAMVEAFEPARLLELAEHCRAFGDDTLNWEAEFLPLVLRSPVS